MGPFIFPDIDPVAIQLGPFAVRWYALAYIVGLVLGWRYCLWLARRWQALVTPRDVDDFLVWATIGVVLGGRLGFVLFYQPGYFFANPVEILKVWRGGMSFHGGLLGVIAAMLLFAWRRKIDVFSLADVVSAAAPIGLFFGRIANFINAELWGRVGDVPWAVVFPGAGDLPRHPSQIYEALLEGLLLFLVLAYAIHARRSLERPGITGGLFLIGYGLARIVAELFREPDAHIGFLALGTTWGQWLSLPMILFGLYLVFMRRSGDKGAGTPRVGKA